MLRLLFEMADEGNELERLILEDIRKYTYPVTALFVAGHIGKPKGVVNKQLYKMKLEKKVVMLDCCPPLWKIPE